MPELLEFDPRRRREFDPNRGLEFEPNRPLEFDPRRPREFQPNRDLGFGRRGVVFRGYVCPVCGALTTATAVQCNECGANFEGTAPAVGPAPPRAGSGPARPAAPKPTSAAPPTAEPAPAPAGATAKGRGTVFCTVCGARLWENDAFCWNCGGRVSGGSGSTAPPHRR